MLKKTSSLLFATALACTAYATSVETPCALSDTIIPGSRPDETPVLEEEPPEAVKWKNITVDPNKVYEMFDVQAAPAFPGGELGLGQYLAKSIQYPAKARKNNIQGMVVVSFVIDETGAVVMSKIVRDIGGGCGDEALRVLKTMPAWQPGAINGQAVKVRYTLPVRFNLE